MDQQDRKDHIRSYQDTPRPMGVYRVNSTASGHGVVDASRDLTAILNRHRAQLDFGGHPDKTLQREWDALGADAFVFEVLDTLEPSDDPDYDPTDDLQELLEMWRERLATE
jgi:hypothetical protein